jgi:diguanylate cyclase (GGDEF)-like protein
MHTLNTHSVLNKLISLTNERDSAALEFSLAKSLFDLIANLYPGNVKPVRVYHIVDIRKQLFSTIAIGKDINEDNLSASLITTLTSCFKSGESCIYEHDNEARATLYPLKASDGITAAIIAIEDLVCDTHLDTTICMLLQIYQNFTKLIRDNEHDTLTGLLNRKSFEHKINKVLGQTQTKSKRNDDKSDQRFYLAIFDIDHFKRVNDQYGHLIGDEVLLLFSQLMKQTFRNSDQLFRFGGEEFIGIFECTYPQDISNALNRFREAISNFDFPQVGKVTVSAGYTEIVAFDISSHLIDRADLALYHAKNNGRNLFSHYEYLVNTGALQENKKEGEIELF